MEIIKVALNALRANKLRSSLTILGIIVGVFSIISISTIIEMLQTSIEEGVSQLGQNTFQIQKFPPVIGGGPRRHMFRNRDDIKLDDYRKLKEMLVEAKSVGAEQWNFGKTLTSSDKETNPNIQICGSTPEAFPNNKWIIADGRDITFRDMEYNANVIVLGEEVAVKLFESRNPVGNEVKVDGRNLRVIGVLEKQGAIFGQSQDNFAIMPITTFQSIYGKNFRSVNITVSSYGKDDYEEVLEKAIGHMRKIRRVLPWEEENFGIMTNESVLNQINDITVGVRIGAIVIAAIALLAAGIGIMNIMLVSVTERTKEIGIRKAVGAKKSNILTQFLTEAVVLCQIGGIVGIAAGVIAGNLAGSFLEAKAVIPWDWVIMGSLLCVLIGVVFGTYPAYKASTLDPIEALRYE